MKDDGNEIDERESKEEEKKDRYRNLNNVSKNHRFTHVGCAAVKAFIRIFII